MNITSINRYFYSYYRHTIVIISPYYPRTILILPTYYRHAAVLYRRSSEVMASIKLQDEAAFSDLEKKVKYTY